MEAYTSRVKFESNVSPDQHELIKLHGWEVAFALGVPLHFEKWVTPVFGDGYAPPRWEKVEPHKPEDGASFEERVWGDLDHMMCHTDRDMSDKLQVECSLASWRETLYRTYMAGPIMPHHLFKGCAVKFGNRTGWLQDETVARIPIVVVSDGDKPVLRPRWPETIRLVQGG